MIRLEAIVPDTKKLMKDIISSTEEEAREVLQRQVDEAIRDVRCPVHDQRPKVKVNPVDLTRSPVKISYKVQNPCCERLEEEVKGVLETG